MKDFIVIASYTGECCMSAHILPVRVKAKNEVEAAELIRQQIRAEDNDPGEVLVFETVEQIETLEEIQAASE